jgi:hypothetical protein
MLEVALDALGLLLHASEVPRSGLHKLQLRARRGHFRDGLLQVRIGHLGGVELGAAAGHSTSHVANDRCTPRS